MRTATAGSRSLLAAPSRGVLLCALAAGCAGDDGGTTGALSAASGPVSASGLSGSTTDDGSTSADSSTGDASTSTSGATGASATATATATTGASTTASTSTTASSTDGATTGAPTDGRAFLHADLWSVWWNDRTRCGAERTFLEICQRRGDDCGLYEAAVAACNPLQVVYGQVGPEKQGE
ncbi:MAG: hypothetical protein KC486_09900, partial [Myxococcales bacterium]|nr:hypothetical protein [Myxococcales bacterium]